MAKLLHLKSGNFLNFTLTLIASFLLVTTGWGQTVKTDKDDYQPGDIVVVTGSGWEPGESVSFDFHETPKVCTTDHHLRSTVADENGNIYYDQFLINERHLGVTFVLTAIGESSGSTAQTTFTDALFFASTILPTNTCINKIGQPFSIEVQNNTTIVGGPNGTTGSNARLGSFKITIPSGFTNLSIVSISNNNWNANLITETGKISVTANGNNDRIDPPASIIINFLADTPNSNGTFEWTTEAWVGNDFSGTKYPAIGSTLNPGNQPKVIVNNAPNSPTAISNSPIIAGGTLNLSTPTITGATYAWSGPGFTSSSQNPSITSVTAAEAGTYSVTVTVGGCTSAAGTVNVVVNTISPTSLSAAPAVGTYGGATTLTATLKSGTTNLAGKTINFSINGTAVGSVETDVNGVAILNNVSIAGINASLNAYAGAINASFSAEAGVYEASSGSGSLTVNKKAASVVVADKTKEYGSADPTLTGTLDGFLAADNVTASYSRVAGETVLGGPYAITATLSPAAVLSNYDITNTAGALSITTKAASVVVADKTKEYGSADPTLTGTLDGFLAADNVTASYSRVAGETVLGGPYAITATLSPAAVLSNYDITNTAGALSITTKAASVVVADKTKEYGSADPTLTGTLSGFLAADLVTAAYSRVAGETVLGGPYAITATLSPAAVLSNYDITNTAGALSITTKAASVVVADKTKEYGSADPTLTGTLSGFLAADLVTAAYSRVAGETVLGGPYAITATLSPAAVLSNYDITNTAGALSITTKAASVVVADKTKEYGSADPTLTGTLSGFLAADLVTAAYSRVAGETVLGGPYAITATLSPAAVLSNYDITNTAGALSITTKAASVVVADKTKEYGSADPTLTGTLSGFLAADLVTASYSRVAGETVLGGPYAITATLSPAAVLSNYDITNTAGALSITTKAASVVVADKTKEYGSADPTLTGTLSGFLAADNVTASYSRVAGETVLGGPYAITATLSPAAVLSNYSITNTPGALSITQRAITITADAKSKFCGQVDPALTYQITSGSLAFNDAFTGELTRVSGETVSEYEIQQGTVALNNNYSLSYVPANLTVKAVTLDVTNAQSPRSILEDVSIAIKVTDGVTKLSDVFVTLKVGAITEVIKSIDGVAIFNLGKLAAGLYSVTAQAGGCSTSEPVFLPIYDPNGGFVTGGGWIESPASAMATGAAGRANFGFNAKYKTGKNNTNEVDGNTNFQFKAGDLHFSSSAHDNMSLVISGAKATYTGTGTVNGIGSHKFRLIAIDGDVSGGGGVDRFRIMIWENNSSSELLYDNRRGTLESADDATGISGGSIVIHKPKAGGKQAETTAKTSTTTIAVAEEPVTVDILGNLAVAPNPVQTEAKVRFTLIEDAGVTLRLYDFNGREIYNLYSGNVRANEVYEVGFQRNNIMSGIYIVKLTTDRGHSYTKNVIVE